MEYDKKINEEYDLILTTLKHHVTLRRLVASIVTKFIKRSPHRQINIMEFGSGRGETTLAILDRLKQLRLLRRIRFISLDWDETVLRIQKKIISQKLPHQPIIYKNYDVLRFLAAQPKQSLDIITASWTLHNFSRKKRKRLLRESLQVLRPGGLFVMMDKYVPDSRRVGKRLYDEQVTLFKKLPLKRENLKALLIHEKKDRTELYIMREKESISLMRELGFVSVNVKKRIHRDVVLTAST